MDRQLAPVINGEAKPVEAATPASADDSSSEDSELKKLAGVLESLPLDARVRVLKDLEGDRRARVLACFSQTAQVETLTVLLGEVA